MSKELLDHNMPVQELRLHMGELSGSEILVARAAIRWANTHLNPVGRENSDQPAGVNATDCNSLTATEGSQPAAPATSEQPVDERVEIMAQVLFNDLAFEEFHHCEESVQAQIEALRKVGIVLVRAASYRSLVEFYDKQQGTPCEQIRHAQEIKTLKEVVKDFLRGASTNAITSDHDETFANLLAKARRAVGNSQQSHSQLRPDAEDLHMENCVCCQAFLKMEKQRDIWRDAYNQVGGLEKEILPLLDQLAKCLPLTQATPSRTQSPSAGGLAETNDRCITCGDPKGNNEKFCSYDCGARGGKSEEREICGCAQGLPTCPKCRKERLKDLVPPKKQFTEGCLGCDPYYNGGPGHEEHHFDACECCQRAQRFELRLDAITVPLGDFMMLIGSYGHVDTGEKGGLLISGSESEDFNMDDAYTLLREARAIMSRYNLTPKGSL